MVDPLTVATRPLPDHANVAALGLVALTRPIQRSPPGPVPPPPPEPVTAPAPPVPPLAPEGTAPPCAPVLPLDAAADPPAAASAPGPAAVSAPHAESTAAHDTATTNDKHAVSCDRDRATMKASQGSAEPTAWIVSSARH